MALIYYASSMSDPGPMPPGMSDKSAHVLAYAALGASLIRALANGRPAAMTSRRVLATMALATLYGLSDELHQRFVPERTPEWLDIVADACGGAAGAVLVAMIARTRRGPLARRILWGRDASETDT